MNTVLLAALLLVPAAGTIATAVTVVRYWRARRRPGRQPMTDQLPDDR